MKNYTTERTWRIITKILPYSYNSRKCYLCLIEKLEIVRNSFPNAAVKASSCYCVMIPKTENDVISKETIIL